MKYLYQKIALMFIASLIAILLQSVTNISTDIAVITNEVSNLQKAVDIVVNNQSKFDEQIRTNEVKQSYLAAFYF